MPTPGEQTTEHTEDTEKRQKRKKERGQQPGAPRLPFARPKSGLRSGIARADRARNAGQWPLAARYYRQALSEEPELPAVWVQYGHVLKELGDLAAAVAAYRESLRLDPEHADTHLQLGHALRLQGEIEGAEAAYLSAAALDPCSTRRGNWRDVQLYDARRA